jgi:Holliday junction resolvasome RuvABC ATP-dependent DNA helicase subunit
VGLTVSVEEFVRAVTPLLEQIYEQTAGEAWKARADVINEAYNLACAFIDADGLATDEELSSLLATFAPLIDETFAATTPGQARTIGLTTGKRAFLSQPSNLFEILLGFDERNDTSYSTSYYEYALAIGHMVASLDAHTSRTELLTIEDFRGLLLGRIQHEPAAPPAAPTAAEPAGTAAPAVTTAPAADTAAAPELTPPRPLDELLAELDALVGMAEVKAEVKLVANLIQVQNLRRSRHLPVHESSRHLIFTGNPGTGKTTVARLLSQIYRTLGVVEKGHLVEADRSSLVAGYVGQTATKVTEAFDKADGGVLLIDEAYALSRGKEEDFGQEAIDTIVKLVEDRRDRLVVIAAGYPTEMGDFVNANPGLKSRFPKTIEFPDYSTDELMAIFESLGAENDYRCDPDAAACLRTRFDAEPRTKGFGNGRLARNLFEEAVGRQANRIVALTDPTDEQLTTLVVADVVAEPPASSPG